MSTTDGSIDQNLFYDLKWIYYFLLTKIVMQIKHLPSTKFFVSVFHHALPINCIQNVEMQKKSSRRHHFGNPWGQSS